VLLIRKTTKVLIITGFTSAVGKSFFSWLENSRNITQYSKILCIGRSTIKLPDVCEFVKLDFNLPTFISPISLNIYDSEVHIFHASSAVPSHKLEYEDFFNTNYNGPMFLIKMLIYNKNLIYFFNLSSTAVYNKNEPGIITENSRKQFNEPYGLSKYLFENECLKIVSSSFNFISLRLPVLLTPNVKNNFISTIKNSLQLNISFSISNADAPFNALILDTDLFNLFDLFISNKLLNDIYNVASQNPISLRNLFLLKGINNYSEKLTNQSPRLISIDKILKLYQLESVENSFTKYLKY